MRKILTASAAALALAGTTLGAVAADARGFHGGYGGYHGGYGGGYGYRGGYYGRGYGYGGAALGAGLIGLAVGASLADRSYGGYGYGYGYSPAYYGPPGDYYAGGYCRSDWRWDGYARRYVRVRYCD